MSKAKKTKRAASSSRERKKQPNGYPGANFVFKISAVASQYCAERAKSRRERTLGESNIQSAFGSPAKCRSSLQDVVPNIVKRT
jgi:hypothetical protein